MADILLDTNVLSELMRAEPDAGVMAWFERRAGRVFHISVITRAEILLGIALLPTGKRRDGLARAAEQMFTQDFAGGCLPFDSAAATEYALIVAARTRAGTPISTEDAQIAAIAQANRMTLATRNIKDFEGIEGLELVNPWKDGMVG
ncbi:MAG: type II toxin-antitoxin system VapC family toxin [Pseudomonadota bacterium]